MSGLQCWDAGGTLVVDLDDYVMRYVGTYSIQSNSASSYTVSVDGMQSTGWLVTFAGLNLYWNNWYCVCNSGSFTANFLPDSAPDSGTYTFNVYKWSA